MDEGLRPRKLPSFPHWPARQLHSMITKFQSPSSAHKLSSAGVKKEKTHHFMSTEKSLHSLTSLWNGALILILTVISYCDMVALFIEPTEIVVTHIMLNTTVNFVRPSSKWTIYGNEKKWVWYIKLMYSHLVYH